MDFHIGLDDSADDLQIGTGNHSALGTTMNMACLIDENGQVLKPLQCAFLDVQQQRSPSASIPTVVQLPRCYFSVRKILMSTLRTNALEGVDAKNSITIVAGAGNITTLQC